MSWWRVRMCEEYDPETGAGDESVDWDQNPVQANSAEEAIAKFKAANPDWELSWMTVWADQRIRDEARDGA